MMSRGKLKNSLTAWSRILLEKLIVSQLVKKFSAFCGTQMFITTFTRSHHLLTYGTRWIQIMPIYLGSVLRHPPIYTWAFQVVSFVKVFFTPNQNAVCVYVYMYVYIYIYICIYVYFFCTPYMLLPHPSYHPYRQYRRHWRKACCIATHHESYWNEQGVKPRLQADMPLSLCL